MTQSQLLLKMFNERAIFNPPLQILEILEFMETGLPDQKEYEERLSRNQRYLDYLEKEKQWYFVNYSTKKELNQAIKQVTKEIEMWMNRKAKRIGFLYDIEIERCLEKKKKLQNLLKSKDFKGVGADKERAKLVPVDHFLDFRAGFVKCLFHKEKTASMHLLPDKTGVWCFSCNKRFDVIDVVQALYNLDFNDAIKFILK